MVAGELLCSVTKITQYRIYHQGVMAHILHARFHCWLLHDLKNECHFYKKSQQVLGEFRYSMIISEKYLRLRDIPSIAVDPFDGGKFVALA